MTAHTNCQCKTILQSQEAIRDQIAKAKALSSFTLDEDFLEHNEEDIHHYLWHLYELLAETFLLIDNNLQQAVNVVKSKKNVLQTTTVE
jgi:hypothetical protein